MYVKSLCYTTVNTLCYLYLKYLFHVQNWHLSLEGIFCCCCCWTPIFCLSMIWLLSLSAEAILCCPHDMLVYSLVGMSVCNNMKYRGIYCQVFIQSCYKTFLSSKTCLIIKISCERN